MVTDPIKDGKAFGVRVRSRKRRTAKRDAEGFDGLRRNA